MSSTHDSKPPRALRSETAARQDLEKMLNKYPKQVLNNPSKYMVKKISKEILALRDVDPKYHSVSALICAFNSIVFSVLSTFSQCRQ